MSPEADKEPLIRVPTAHGRITLLGTAHVSRQSAAKVHELLTAAAAKTEGIESEPAPFVLQTALNDFYVEYELNATTHDPQRNPRI